GLKSLQSALEGLSSIGAGNVKVVNAGNVYRITFQGTTLGGADQPLLQAHDRNLTNGLGATDTVNVDDSGFPQSTATINGPATAGDLLSISITGGFGTQTFSYAAHADESPE